MSQHYQHHHHHHDTKHTATFLLCHLHDVPHDERPNRLVVISQVLDGQSKPRVRQSQHLLQGKTRAGQ